MRLSATVRILCFLAVMRLAVSFDDEQISPEVLDILYLDLFVVTDHTMYENYGEELDSYTETIINYVGRLFRDANLRVDIEINLVGKLHFKSVKDERKHLIPFPENMNDAHYLLGAFCTWQGSYLRKKYDYKAAILMTRRDITGGSDLNTLGVANKMGACSDNMACAIIEDKGFSTAFTITHEIGHLLNLPHDDDRDSCKGPTQRRIMSSLLDASVDIFSWSKCSASHIRKFVKSRKSKCLRMKGRSHNTTYTGNTKLLLPGEYYNEEKQCSFYNKSYSSYYTTSCRQLVCRSPTGSLAKLHFPKADGTPCGYKDGLMCYRGRCTDFNEPIKPLNGGWGRYKKVGTCSIPCGGGIQYAVRKCNNPIPTHGGRYCSGRRVKFWTCNRQTCEPSIETFHQKVCSQYDGNTFNRTDVKPTVKWQAKLPVVECNVKCYPAGDFDKLPILIDADDGIPCKRKDPIRSYGKCVQKKCQPFGCDGKFNSKKAYDQCGICGGNNDTCEWRTGMFKDYVRDYKMVTIIPVAAKSVRVELKNPNPPGRCPFLYLGVKKLDASAENRDMLNMGYLIASKEKNVPLGPHAYLRYNRSCNDIAETIDIMEGSVPESLEIYVLGYLGEKATVNYKMIEPKELTYAWGHEPEWSNCSALCRGIQSKRAICILTDTKTRAAENYCLNKDLKKPPNKIRECTNKNCKVKWRRIGNDRSICSAAFGLGERRLRFECVAMSNNSPVQLLQNDICLKELGKHQRHESCYSKCSWQSSEWSTCKQDTCVRERTIWCERKICSCNSACETKRNTTECTASMCTKQCIRTETKDQNCYDFHKPKTEISCRARECKNKEQGRWKSLSWSSCSVTCGVGFRRRYILCQAMDGRRRPDRFCSAMPRPDDKIECEESLCAHWSVSDWGECDSPCGSGNTRRDVSCRYDDGSWAPHDMCIAEREPQSEKTCDRGLCGQWRAGAWSACNANECDEEGTQTREVKCIGGVGCAGLMPTFERNCLKKCDDEWLVGDWSECSRSCGTAYKTRKVSCPGTCLREKPAGKSPCHFGPCPIWTTSDFSDCSTTCGKGHQYRTISCRNPHNGQILENDLCSDEEKPYPRSACFRPCRHYRRNRQRSKAKWKASAFSSCSHSCGMGIQIRAIHCVRNRKNVDLRLCKESEKPVTYAYCHLRRCFQ